MEERFHCCECGEELTEDEVMYFEDEYYCEECLNEITYICDCCGNRVHENDVISDDNIALCGRCYDNHYYRCEECDRIIHSDNVYYSDDEDDRPLCYDCYHEGNYSSIRPYSFKPSPLFHGKGKRFFGVELEVDEGGHDKDNATTILDIGNYDDENIYIKNDGSIRDGFEIVSHPCTLSYHKEEFPWQDIMNKLINMGYLSHKTSTCGLHCHINRNSLGDTREEQEEVIARILYFVEHHWDEMLKFSRRTESQIQQWAARYGRKDKPKEFIDNVKKSYDFSRYRCINLVNYNTIEFRLYRGTLKYNTFIATLQLTNEICETALKLTDDEMTGLTWEEFIGHIGREENSELFTYLAERSLITETTGGN